MLLILATFCVNVLVYVALAKSGHSKKRSRVEIKTDSPSTRSLVWQGVSEEFRAWLIVAAALCTLFLLFLVYAYLFGPIPPIHEWGS